MQGDANLRGAVDDVVVGDDVAVRRDDDAAADAMLDLRALLGLGIWPPKKRRNSGGICCCTLVVAGLRARWSER